MAEKKLSIRLSLNDKQFQSGLRKASSRMKRFGNQMQRTGQTLSRSLTLPLLAFGAASVKAFDEQIKAETSLRTALGGSEDAFKRLKTQAQELQKTTLFGDEETIQAQSFLAQMSLSEDAIIKLIPLIQDFATAQKISLGDAAKLVAKSVGSSTNALSRYGIIIEGAVGSTDRLESATSALSKGFAGQSEAIAKEGLGPFIQLKNELGDVAEQFGELILNNIEPLKKALSSLAEKLRNLTTDQKESIVKWAGYVAIIGPALLIIGKIITSIGSLGKALLWLNANPMVLIVTSVAALTAAIGLAFLDLEKFTKTAMKLGRVGKIIASGLLAVLGPTNPDMIAARALLAMDFDSFESDEPIGTREEADATFKQSSSGVAGGGIKRTLQEIPPLIEPIKASFEQAFSPAMQFATDGSYMDGMLRNIAITANLSNLAEEIGFKFENFGNTLTNIFANALQSQEGFFKSFAEGAKQALKAVLAQIVAMTALNALLGGTGLGGMLGLKDIGGIGGIGKLFGFADGGMVTGATLAMVGEGPGTSLSNPEVIAPLDKLQSMMGGSGAVEVFGTISGSDILLSSDRARNNRNRTRGY